MKLDKGNRAITEHAKEGRALHVFKTLGKSKGQEYLGEFSYASHAFRDGPDITGSQRRTIVFHLVPVGRLSEVADDPDDTEGQVEAISLEEARRRALAAFEPTVQAGTALVWRSIHKRSKAVREYVLMRSSGRCESCHEPAPFMRRNGTPYLEPHHTTRVSDGGLDHPRHVGAICPTCHSEIHFGIEGESKNAELIMHLGSIEST